MTGIRGTLARSKIVAVLVLVVCVALCAAAVRSSEALLEYDRVTGTVGTQIDLAGGWLRVDRLRVAQQLTENDVVTASTSGLFVVMRITVATTGTKKLHIGKGSVVTRDRTYGSWSSVSFLPDSGFSTAREVVFEVDPAQIDDLTLWLEPGSIVYQYESHIAVHLGITAANADGWRAAGQGRALRFDDRYVDEGLR